MAVLSELTITDLELLTRELRLIDATDRSMAAVAADVTGLLHRSLTRPDGSPACIVVRISVTQPLRALPAELAEIALEMDPGVDEDTTCLVSLASNGAVDRPVEAMLPAESALPLTAHAFEDLPIMPQVLDEVGLGLNEVSDAKAAVAVRLQHRTFNVFLAHDLASDVALLPDPEYRRVLAERGMVSLVVLGGILPTGGTLLISFQTNVTVDQRVADLLRPLAVAVKAALIPTSFRVFEPA